MERVGMKVFSGNANLPLAEAICKELGLPLGDMKVGHFADGEINVRLMSSRFLAIFLKQLQLENTSAAATSTTLNFIKFFIIGKS